MNFFKESQQTHNRFRWHMDFPDALAQLSRNRINDLIIGKGMLACDVVTPANGTLVR